MVERHVYVYEITNSSNGKRYIGKSVAPHARWQRHLDACADTSIVCWQR